MINRETAEEWEIKEQDKTDEEAISDLRGAP